MRGFLAFIAFIGLIGFAIWQHTTISSLNERVASLDRELNALHTSRATTIEKKIICPLCHGERIIAFTPPWGTKLQTQSEPCPVCLGLGYRMLKILAGYKICPDCQGMGIVFFPTEPSHRVPHNNCGRCRATGLIAETK